MNNLKLQFENNHVQEVKLLAPVGFVVPAVNSSWSAQTTDRYPLFKSQIECHFSTEGFSDHSHTHQY